MEGSRFPGQRLCGLEGGKSRGSIFQVHEVPSVAPGCESRLVTVFCGSLQPQWVTIGV